MFQTKVVEKIKTYIGGSITFFSENRTVYEIRSKNITEPGRPQKTMWCMCIACWILKATNIQLECVILIVFQCKNGCTNAPRRCCKCSLPVLVIFILDFSIHFLYTPVLLIICYLIVFGEILNMYCLSPIYAICSAHLIVLDLIIPIIIS